MAVIQAQVLTGIIFLKFEIPLLYSDWTKLVLT